MTGFNSTVGTEITEAGTHSPASQSELVQGTRIFDAGRYSRADIGVVALGQEAPSSEATQPSTSGAHPLGALLDEDERAAFRGRLGTPTDVSSPQAPGGPVGAARPAPAVRR